MIDINDGTFNANGNVSVTGGTLQRTSAGTFTWASGKIMFVQAGGMVNITGDYTTPTSASININGSGSAFQQLTSGGLNIATGTTVNVQNTGLLSGLALSVGTNGLVNVDGGTFNESGDISLNGGRLTQTSTAGSAFNWSAGHTMTVQAGGQFNVYGNYITPNNSIINLTGATSQINSTGLGFNVANGSTLNISNGASVTVAGIISVDFLSMINFSSGTMTVGDLRTLGNPTHFNWTGGTLNITGAGGVEVGSVAELGSPFFVAPACILNVTNTTAIDASAKLQAFGPVTSGSLNNSGELDAIGTTVALTNASTNVSGGKISLISSTLNLGSGANKLTNTGRINLTDVTVNGDIQSNSGGVINSAGNVTFNGSITGGASLLQISDGKTLIGAEWQSRCIGFGVSLGGNLDLSNNKLIVAGGTLGAWNGTNYTGITGSIKSGRNGGAWNGSGIVTSQSDAVGVSPLTTLAVALAGDIQKTSLGGISLLPTDVVTMYTYAGDADLSGRINGDDYFRIDSGFTAHATGYENGDFNFDGKVDADDYFIIDRNYSRQTSGFSSGAPLGGVVAVPEPGGDLRNA